MLGNAFSVHGLSLRPKKLQHTIGFRVDDFFVTAIASLLFVVDPIGVVPAYLALSSGEDPQRRRRTALRASVFATLVIAGFAAAGKYLLRAVGLSLEALQVAGGLILFLTAMEMLQANRASKESPEELDEGLAKDDVAITPLAIPMLAGPASLSTVATLMSRADGWLQISGVYVAVLVTGIVSYITLRLSSPIYRILGQTGTNALSRLLGLVLAGIAVQFVLDGLKAAGVIR